VSRTGLITSAAEGQAIGAPISRRRLIKEAARACGVIASLALTACGGSATSSAPQSQPAGGLVTGPGTWDQLQAAARSEGHVVVLGPPDPQARTLLPDLFKQRFGIDLEYQAGNTSQQAAMVGSQRAAGQYLVDAVLGGSDTAYGTLLPKGWIDPIKPLLIPEVADASKWKTGGPWFRDPNGDTVLQLFNTVGHSISINADILAPTDVPTGDALLDAKWKGKICAYDPGVNGSGIAIGSALYVGKGKDWVTRLYKGQNVVLSRDYQQIADWVAHGSYPIAIGAFTNYFAPYIKEGIHIAWPRLPDLLETTSGAFGLLCVWNRAPHPNAARLFANWIASKDGLSAYAKTQAAAPVRNDIDPTWVAPDLIPQPGVKYFDTYDYQFEMNERLGIRDYYASILR
jgi:iron(III) transport system substrate-binding protein